MGRRRRDISSREPRDIEEWESRLIEEGVSSEWAPGLAARLMEISEAAEGGALNHTLPAAALIQGAVAATELQADAKATVERNMRDVREVERLLGAFSGELEKLDEVLEVLSAYAQRMRAKPGQTVKRVLH
ncbi:MAG: hypothetical protein AB8G23_08545 [Myxococcota bacterium]